MLPSPLHPAVVHFPIVLTVLLPFVAIVCLLAIRRGANVRRLWAIPLVLAAVLAGSAWFAEETGGEDEERVEAVVPEAALETHEERAERFVVLSGALMVVMGAGLLGGPLGSAARVVGTVGAVALLVPMAMVGSSGGDLVYEHGAGAAWSNEAGVGTPAAVRPGQRGTTPESGEEETAAAGGSGETR